MNTKASTLKFDIETWLCLKLDRDSETALYHLPVHHWVLPPGMPVPQKGQEVTFAVFKPQAEPEVLEPRIFEVLSANSYLQFDFYGEERRLFRNEITLVLKDLGPVMTNEQGHGALGAADPVTRRRKANR